VGPRAVLDGVVKIKIPSPRRESNPRTPIVQPVASAIPTELSHPIHMGGIIKKEELRFLRGEGQ
jgi:hypothetical protein